MSWRVFIRKIDWVLICLALTILAISMATFYDISPRAGHIINRQVIFISIGLVLALILAALDYRIFKNYSASVISLYAISIILLILALASRQIRGVSSWIVFESYQFQPSEFAKLAVLILLAKYFSQKHTQIHSVKYIIASGFYAGIPAFLTLIQPDLGSTLVFLGLWLSMLIFSGINKRHLATMIMVGLLASLFAWFFVLRDYQKDRITSFVNPYTDPRGVGYNIIQSQTTFGSGRLTGTVLANNEKKLPINVPEPYTDFVVSVFGRKFGFLGVTALILLVAGLIFRVGLIGSRSKNNFAKLYCLGLMTIIFVHVGISLGMNLGVLPITGIPFSFLSYGGSHLVVMMAALGIVESIKLRN